MASKRAKDFKLNFAKTNSKTVKFAQVDYPLFLFDTCRQKASPNIGSSCFLALFPGFVICLMAVHKLMALQSDCPCISLLRTSVRSSTKATWMNARRLQLPAV